MSDFKLNSEVLKLPHERMKAAGMNQTAIAKELSFAKQIFDRTPYLQKCGETKHGQNSLLSAIINIANVGLTLNPITQECSLVPRWNSKLKCVECTLMPEYKGLIRLMIESGAVQNILTGTVYEDDFFELEPTDFDKPITHKPNLTIKPQIEKFVGAYAVAVLPSGAKQVEWVYTEDVMKIRECSDSYKAFVAGKTKTCVWVQWFDQMAKKSAVKRLNKWVRGVSDKLDKAVELDNQDYQADFWQYGKIEDLLNTSNIDEKTLVQIEASLHNQDLSKHQAKGLIEYLKNNQLEESVRNGNTNSIKTIGKNVKMAVDMPNT